MTVAPDLFNGTPAPEDINGTPNFNVTEFLNDHRPEVTDPLIASTLEFIKNEQGAKKVVATGYCFGGRYAFRVLAEGKGVDAAFAAHPSLLEDAEIEAITGPASIAAAGEFLPTKESYTSSIRILILGTETDSMMPPERRHEISALLQQTEKAYSVALYSGTDHGFGVRANVSDPEEKFGKEEAFIQAVRWFNAWA